MKLTALLIDTAPSYTNTLHDRHLSLASLQIPHIENLGAARDIHDTIDLCNNDIRHLTNFPHMPRVKTLLLANNRITRIDTKISESLPGLRELVLTGNGVGELRDLEPLVGCTRLSWLSLVGCPVTGKRGYREWVVWRFPNLRVLDFEKVKDRERAAARRMYGESWDKPTEAAEAILTQRVGAGATGLLGSAGAETGVSERDQENIRRAIREAKTLDEVRRLEAMLRSGQIPK